MAIREPPILLVNFTMRWLECSHVLAQRPQRSLGGFSVGIPNAHTVASDSCDAVRPDSAHDLST